MKNEVCMSKTIKIDINNSFGIIKFNHNFEFDSKSNFYGLYAQNGTMKSSFAKTMLSYSRGEPIYDHLFNEHTGSCTVSEIEPENILSFPSFDGRTEICDEAASLVANEQVKLAYNKALESVECAYNIFTAKLSEQTKTQHVPNTNEIIEGMFRSFISIDSVETITIPAVIQLLKSISSEINNGNMSFCEIGYKSFIGANFIKFVENKKYQGFFADLAKAYDEFRATPTYYRNGFDASSAQKLIKAISDSKYFKANHSVILKDKDGNDSSPILKTADLEKNLKTDFDLIIEQYPLLKAPLENLIKDFSVGTNGDVRAMFEDSSKRDLLLFMGNKNRFYKNMWYGYLAGCLNEIQSLITIYDAASKDIKTARDEAVSCENEWENARDIFNDRFNNLPYKLEITNKSDAIVNDLVRPVFEIRYENPRDLTAPYCERPDGNNQLRIVGSVLSNGERKALHLLNIIFQLQSKLKEDKEILVVFDDIVESFDYKNKYAFFEYLQELASEHANLYIITLTHNFDFFRLVYEKIHPRNDNQFKIITKSRDLKLEVVDMFNPRIFGVTKDSAPKDKAAWLSLIPFARNLIEFRSGQVDDIYKKLTKCLHVMSDKYTIADIFTDINDNTGVSVTPFSQEQDVHDAIISTAREIASSDNDNFNLHNNITLAIGTRLVIERYIITKINNEQYTNVQAKEHDQTRGLIKLYKNNVSDKSEKYKDEKVKRFNCASMMVDGSIHLNSFMYEPLIDMGTWELKDMFNKTEELLQRK